MAGHTDARALTSGPRVGGEAGGGAGWRRGLGWGCGAPSRRPTPVHWLLGPQRHLDGGYPRHTFFRRAHGSPLRDLPSGIRGVCFWGLLPFRLGRDNGAFGRPLGTVLFIIVTGVTLSVWIPRELRRYTPSPGNPRLRCSQLPRQGWHSDPCSWEESVLIPH